MGAGLGLSNFFLFLCFFYFIYAFPFSFSSFSLTHFVIFLIFSVSFFLCFFLCVFFLFFFFFFLLCSQFGKTKSFFLLKKSTHPRKNRSFARKIKNRPTYCDFEIYFLVLQLHQILKPIRLLFCKDSFCLHIYLYINYIPYYYQAI